MKPSAKIICDSISPDGVRLTTMEVVMHRFVLAEFNTHRVFSRNSASSRAIPTQKILDKIATNPALPVYYGKQQKGMQADEELDKQQIFNCQEEIKELARKSMEHVIDLSNNLQLHKQSANRYLEPWMWHTVIVTATEWDNFFWQRCSPLAQPEMKAAADQMQLAYYTSTPKFVDYGEWHLPYIMEEDEYEICSIKEPLEQTSELQYLKLMSYFKRISVARCARVSVLQQDGIRAIEKDLEMFDRLRNAMPIHISPFEHVATPIDDRNFIAGKPVSPKQHPPFARDRFIGNFRGWLQFRKEIPNENLTKFIPNLPELEHIAKQMRGE